VTCDPENSNYDAYEFGVESDTIKKNNHPVDVDEMVRGKALKKALEIINGERQGNTRRHSMTFDLWITDLAITSATLPSRWYFLLTWGPLTWRRQLSLNTNL
jgi:hypothetical protein